MSWWMERCINNKWKKLVFKLHKLGKREDNLVLALFTIFFLECSCIYGRTQRVAWKCINVSSHVAATLCNWTQRCSEDDFPKLEVSEDKISSEHQFNKCLGDVRGQSLERKYWQSNENDYFLKSISYPYNPFKFHAQDQLESRLLQFCLPFFSFFFSV